MIRKALGLGLMIIILKFLMKSVFVAFESSAIGLFNTANILMSKLGSTPTDIDHLIPR